MMEEIASFRPYLKSSVQTYLDAQEPKSGTDSPKV
jgi:hypothetical protein